MNKEEITKLEVKMPLITDDDIRILDNNFSGIVNGIIKVQCNERDKALLQLIIKKQQQALIDIRDLANNNVGLNYYIMTGVRDRILQIIHEVIGDDER